MDKETQEYYESLLELFIQKGWKTYQEDLSRSLTNLSDIETISDEKQFWFRRGQVDILKTLINYQNFITQGYEDIEDDKSI